MPSRCRYLSALRHGVVRAFSPRVCVCDRPHVACRVGTRHHRDAARHASCIIHSRQLYKRMPCAAHRCTLHAMRGHARTLVLSMRCALTGRPRRRGRTHRAIVRVPPPSSPRMLRRCGDMRRLAARNVWPRTHACFVGAFAGRRRRRWTRAIVCVPRVFRRAATTTCDVYSMLVYVTPPSCAPQGGEPCVHVYMSCGVYMYICRVVWAATGGSDATTTSAVVARRGGVTAALHGARCAARRRGGDGCAVAVTAAVCPVWWRCHRGGCYGGGVPVPQHTHTGWAL